MYKKAKHLNKVNMITEYVFVFVMVAFSVS